MSIFIHLAPEKFIKKIRASGIKNESQYWYGLKGFFCMPVLSNFYISHQWMRELKRSGQRTVIGVQFKLNDNEDVYVGHYNKEPVKVKAPEAVKIILEQENAMGFEVFLPRKLFAKEIVKIKHLPQKVGWRYYPEAKGRTPCGCPVCIPRGESYSKKIKEKWERENS